MLFACMCVTLTFHTTSFLKHFLLASNNNWQILLGSLLFGFFFRYTLSYMQNAIKTTKLLRWHHEAMHVSPTACWHAWRQNSKIMHIVISKIYCMTQASWCLHGESSSVSCIMPWAWCYAWHHQCGVVHDNMSKLQKM